MSADTEERKWIEDLEVDNAQIKWAWSHFDGRADGFNDEGDHNFQLIIPDEKTARELQDIGWAVREVDGYEEGDPPQYLLRCKISYKYSQPKIYLIKNNRKLRADERDLADIRRDTCERIDLILTPSRWVNGARTGVTAYVKELYATVKESRFAERYSDYEEI